MKLLIYAEVELEKLGVVEKADDTQPGSRDAERISLRHGERNTAREDASSIGVCFFVRVRVVGREEEIRQR